MQQTAWLLEVEEKWLNILGELNDSEWWNKLSYWQLNRPCLSWIQNTKSPGLFEFSDRIFNGMIYVHMYYSYLSCLSTKYTIL